MTFEVTADQVERMLEQVRRDLADRIMDESGDSLRLVSKHRAAGMLDVDYRTLESLEIPRVNLGRKVAYRLRDIQAFIEANLEK